MERKSSKTDEKTAKELIAQAAEIAALTKKLDAAYEKAFPQFIEALKTAMNVCETLCRTASDAMRWSDIGSPFVIDYGQYSADSGDVTVWFAHGNTVSEWNKMWTARVFGFPNKSLRNDVAARILGPSYKRLVELDGRTWAPILKEILKETPKERTTR